MGPSSLPRGTHITDAIIHDQNFVAEISALLRTDPAKIKHGRFGSLLYRSTKFIDTMDKRTERAILCAEDRDLCVAGKFLRRMMQHPQELCPSKDGHCARCA
jgi:hypothetical protein